MRGRRHVGEVELGDLAHRGEDVVQLRAEPLDLVVAQLEAGQPGDVEQLLALMFAIAEDPSRNGRAPAGAPSQPWFRQVL